MKPTTKFASAPYLGTDETVEVRVRRGAATRVEARHDGIDHAVVEVVLTGKEDLTGVQSDALMGIEESYADKMGASPTDRLVEVWEALLEKCLAGVK